MEVRSLGVEDESVFHLLILGQLGPDEGEKLAQRCGRLIGDIAFFHLCLTAVMKVFGEGGDVGILGHCRDDGANLAWRAAPNDKRIWCD